MIRTVIQIDEEKCTGCGICADACHEGAIEIVDGKAKLIRDDYCDGLGDCLPSCPEDAISFVEREAAAYDEEAVQRNIQSKIAAGTAGAALREAAASQSGGREAEVAPVPRCGVLHAMTAERRRGRSQLLQVRFFRPS